MPFSSRIVFFTIIFGLLFGLQFLSAFTFKSFLKRQNVEGWKLNLAAFGPFILFDLLLLYPVIAGRSLAFLPKIIVYPFYIFQAAIVFIGLYLLIAKIIKTPFWLINLIASKIDAFKGKYKKLIQKKSVVKFNQSRRKFITGTTAAVSGYAFLGAGLGVMGRDEAAVTEAELKIENLPEELKGVTMTLISDIHSGPYMEESMMKNFMEQVKAVNSDIVLISGDITNSNRNEIQPFVNAFRDIKAKHGVYATLGNHDYFSDPEYIAEAIVKDSPVKLLRNEGEIITINNKRLCLLGTEDTRKSSADYDPVIFNNFELTINNAKSKAGDYDSLPKIMLYHKPYFFEHLAKKGMDAVLSGHTHGGQVVLAKFGNNNFSLAATVSPYVSGLYKCGKSSMYVSNGLGVVALPIRLNCPPEITKLKLV